MRALFALFALAVVSPALTADPPARKVEIPSALLEFSGGRTLNKWTTTFVMTTASGATYELAIDYGDRGNMYARDSVKAMLAANWLVEPTERREVRIHGVRAKNGKADPVKTLTATNRLRGGKGQMPTLLPFGGARVEVKTDDGKAKSDPARKAPPKGPTFPNDTFVEFDMSTLPAGQLNVFWKFTCEVRTTAGKEEPWIRAPIEVNSDKAGEYLAEMFEHCLPECGFKAELVGTTKLRVYGAAYEGRYYPAERGTVESPHLKPEQLPKITNPKRL